METKAIAKYIRISPKKVRLVLDAVRGTELNKAISVLRLMNKKGAKPVIKLINSAVANAEHNFELDKNNLYIKEIKADEAPTLRRWMPRAHGRATIIRKRSSHLTLVLSEIKDSGKKEGKKSDIEAPIKLGDMDKKEKQEAKKEIKEEKKEEVKAVKQGKGDVFDEGAKDDIAEKGKEINDPRREGRGGHARAEGGKKGFASKIFRRKSG